MRAYPASSPQCPIGSGTNLRCRVGLLSAGAFTHDPRTVHMRRVSMESRRCTACGQVFRPRPQVPQQCYCAAPVCQRERRRHWQQAKRKSDPAYQDNQTSAQLAWHKRNPDYWREYRRTHPEYSERNRMQQRERNDRRRERLIAKMDVSTVVFPIPSGRYQISQPSAVGIAKMDAWTVQITLLPTQYD